MAVPSNIRDFLNREQIKYEVINHHRTATLEQAANACELPIDQMVRAVILVDQHGPLMAILPASHVLDFDALCSLLHRDLEPVPGNRLESIFDDCEPCSYPPLASLYGLDVIVDTAIEALDTITFEPGVHTALVQISSGDYQQLTGDALTGSFSRPASTLRADPDDCEQALARMVEKFTPARVKRGIEEFHDLPPLPATAAQILQLANEPLADARQLADIVEQDAPLAAQILRYANSPLYGYGGTIKDLKSAIARVLGFDYAMNLALGFSIGQSLSMPQYGPFGLDSFWKHSVYAARLVELLAQHLPKKQQPRRGTAYLAGLLQNLGRLVLSQTFKTEFFILNRLAQANPDMPARDLERQVLGVTHERIGAWLMEAWGLPEELIVAAKYHHQEDYWDRHATYSQLVLIANRALAMHGIGEGEERDFPDFCLDMLGLNEQQVRDIADRLLADTAELENLATRLAA